jgi:hypothetical protein
LGRIQRIRPLAQQARASALPCFPLSRRWHRDPICQGTFFLPTTRVGFPSIIVTDRNPSPNPSLSFLGTTFGL